jgi:hypothetical protein
MAIKMAKNSKPDSVVIHAIEQFQSHSHKRLNFGSGDGTSGGGMEPRVAKLEAAVEHIQKDIAEIKSDVREFRSAIGSLSTSSATLTERVSHLPSKGFIVTCLVSSLGAVAALIVFQSSIQTLLKLPH